MTVRKLDDSGDIVTSGTQFLTGAEEVAQTVQTRLKLFLGEYFRNINDGTPWFQQILGKGSSLNVKESQIKRRISQTPDVLSISSFSSDFDLSSRKYTVRASVVTPYGEASFTLADVI